MSHDVIVRPMEESDLGEADRVMRVAFGTFLGMPEPSAFMGDARFVEPRWRTDTCTAYVAEVDGRVVGSNFAARWGSFAFLGPITTRPDMWDRGIGSQLMDPVMELFGSWEVELAGLFTFPQSAKHLGLYHKHGFRPRFLTAVMSHPTSDDPAAPPPSRLGDLSESDRPNILAACRAVTDALFAGLDLEGELRAIRAQRLGDTVLLRDGADLVGFAACHHGPGTEAGGDTCYVKFGAVEPGHGAEQRFETLVAACLAHAADVGATRLIAGVNTSRTEAYDHLRRMGFRSEMFGIAMHRPNEAGFSRPGMYVIDDWR